MSGIQLDEVIPLGRLMSEYIEMFDLDIEKYGTYLDCGAGPSSFNYEMTLLDKVVISIDPVYEYGKELIKARMDETFENVIEQVKESDAYDWSQIGSVEALRKRREDAATMFFRDFDAGWITERYQYGLLPNIDYNSQVFDIGLVSHLLFLYSDQLSYDFHLASIREMCRVAKEVRIYPLIDLQGNISSHIEGIVETLEGEGLHITFEPSQYLFVKGATHYMKITREREA